MPQGSTPPPKDDQERAFFQKAILAVGPSVVYDHSLIYDEQIDAVYDAARMLLEVARKAEAFAPTTQGEPE